MSFGGLVGQLLLGLGLRLVAAFAAYDLIIQFRPALWAAAILELHYELGAGARFHD
jgi:hypothetical protein